MKKTIVDGLYLETNKDVHIEITNKVSRLVQVLTLTKGTVTYEWTTEVIADGIYYYPLLIDNQQVDTGTYLLSNNFHFLSRNQFDSCSF